MSPLEIYLDKQLIFTTGTDASETPVTGVPLTVRYSGDKHAGVVTIKDCNGDYMTQFGLPKEGDQKTMRFTQDVHLVENGKAINTCVMHKLYFRRS